MIQTETRDGTTVVHPEGAITAANADELRAELLGLINEGARSIEIDLAEVGMIDSRGLSVFVMCHRSLQENDGTLTVVTDAPDLRGLFRLLRLDEHFTVRGSS